MGKTWIKIKRLRIFRYNQKPDDMKAVCANCNHWAPEAPVVANKENYGECNKLSHLESKMDPDYIIPVLNDGRPMDPNVKAIEFITGANFGCNQFASA